jgi:hypothetical protein
VGTSAIEFGAQFFKLANVIAANADRNKLLAFRAEII